MRYFHILPVLILIISVSGCFSGKRPEEPAFGGSEEWRLKSLEENFLNFKEGMHSQKDLIESNYQQTRTDVDLIQDRLNKLDDSIAELKVAQQKIIASQSEISIAAVPVSVPVPVVEEIVSSSNEEKPWMNVPGEKVEDVAVVAPVTPPKSFGNVENLYKEGVNFVMNDAPLKGRKLLLKFLKKSPANKLAPNALYWIGETYYSEKNFAQSILKFKEVSRRFPKANKVPDSMLKIGLAYDKLGDKDNAIFYLQTLLDEYPKSSSAKIAASRLREIEG
ncbi:MAG: tol-pal system protein YbgF [Desulfovibrio sp. S3730MH75]|nr:MAG: tol-pal system protein YbgF [Desulfovibrio sp. S3730MH75]